MRSATGRLELGGHAMETALGAWNEDVHAVFSVYSAIMKRGWGVAQD